jgi:hypothetical protein
VPDGCPARGWGRPQLGQSGHAGVDGLDGKVGQEVVMVSLSVYAFKNWRHTRAGCKRPMLGRPTRPDWAVVRWAGTEGRVGRSGRWAKFRKGIGKWFVNFWTPEI